MAEDGALERERGQTSLPSLRACCSAATASHFSLQRSPAGLPAGCAHGAFAPAPRCSLLLCRSVFYLPKPRALNYLVGQCFAKPTLVLQVPSCTGGGCMAGWCMASTAAGLALLRRAAVQCQAQALHITNQSTQALPVTPVTIYTSLATDSCAAPLPKQGKHDPLNDAKARAGDLGRLCGNAEVVLLEAGHCPHDEVPDLVNRHIITFVQQRVLPNMAAAASGGSSVEAAEGQQRRA